MPGENWHNLSIAEVSALMRAGTLTSAALTKHMLERIDRRNPSLNAFITVTRELALEAAGAADAERSRGRWRGPLHGVPIAIKDNIAVSGVRMTCGSELFADLVPEHDAEVVRRLKDAGAVILGKVGMHELAYGTTSDNPFFGAIRNPLDARLDAGGSSGGSASAVGARLAFAALGTDTACSIRFPAHCCGVVGFKPSFNAISTDGVVPLVASLDHVGTLTRTVSDAALAFAAATGLEWQHAAVPDEGLAGLRIGVMRRFFFDGEPEIVGAVEECLSDLQRLGAVIVDLDEAGVENSLTISTRLFREAYEAFGGELSSRRARFSPSALEKLERKSRITLADYEDALGRLGQFAQTMDAAMRDCDALVAPAATTMPAVLGSWHDDYDLQASKNATVFNLSGQPSIAIPVRRPSQRRPIGLMLSGRRGDDAGLLGRAALVEQSLSNN
jgi:aspartyl-tRNA(Asn)/glutamyl-tRNA(Gln) amidotransferase subunit A